MTRARPLAVLLPAGALLVAAALAWWLLGDDAARPAAPAPRAARHASPAGERDAPAPLRPAPESEALALPDAAPGDALAAATARLREELALRRLTGRVRRADGGPLPDDLVVHARATPPRPREIEGVVEPRSGLELRALRGVDGDEGGDDDASDDTRAAALAQLTRAEVDAEGRFIVEHFPAVGGWLQLEHPWWYVRDPEPVTPGQDHVELVIVRGALVAGRVLGADGAPAPDLGVTATSPVDPWQIFEGSLRVVRAGHTVTDPDGRFELGPIPPGSALVLRVAGGGPHQPGKRELAPLERGERREVELRLEAAAHVGGRVLDEAGAPVAGARVRLMNAALDMLDMEMGGEPPSTDARTDAAGHFAFDGVAAGSYRLVLAAGGFVPAMSAEPFELEGGERRDDFELRALRGRSVTGRVVDAASGAPIQGAAVTGAWRPSMTNLRANMDREYREAVRTDRDGRFELSGFEHDALRLWVSARGHARTELDVQAGARDVLVELPRTARVSGVVVALDDAEPVAEFLVGLVPKAGLLDPASFANMSDGPRPQPPERVSDPDGRFVLTDVRPGRYELRVDAAGFARAVVDELEIAAGQSLDGVVVYAEPEARVTGRVLAADTREPVPDALLGTDGTDMASRLTAALTRPGPRTRTGPDGRFELRGLGDGPVQLLVSHRDFMDLGLDALRLAPGEQRDLGELLLRRGASLYGELVDERGAPDAGVTVLASNVIGTTIKRSTSDQEGRWRVRGLPADTYNVTRLDLRFDANAASAAGMLEDMVSATVTLEADEERRVALAPAAAEGTRLEGVVRGRAGPARDATLIAMTDEGTPQPRFASTDAEGRYAFRGLSEERWLIQVLPVDGDAAGGAQGMGISPVMELVDVGPGPVQRHDIELPGGELAGRVVAADDGRALPGVRVVLERSDAGRPSSRLLALSGGRVGETYTGPDGGFRFRHLAAGRYDVTAGGTNMVGMGETGWARRTLADQQVHETRADFTVELALEPGAAVVGHVRDPAGRPLANVPVWARHDASGRWLAVFSETQTGTAGGYRLEGLEPGSWTLVFGGVAHAVHVSAGHVARAGAETTVDAVLVEGTEIVVSREGGLEGVDVQLSGASGTLPTGLSSVSEMMGGGGANAGQRRLARVPPGSYRLTAWADGALLVDRQLAVPPGQDALHVALDSDD